MKSFNKMLKTNINRKIIFFSMESYSTLILKDLYLYLIVVYIWSYLVIWSLNTKTLDYKKEKIIFNWLKTICFLKFSKKCITYEEHNAILYATARILFFWLNKWLKYFFNPTISNRKFYIYNVILILKKTTFVFDLYAYRIYL